MLESWNDTAAKRQILEFVASVSAPGDTFVPVPERIATFDLDGTLWCEKPRFVQAEFLLRRAADTSRDGSHDGGMIARARGLLDRIPDVVAGVADVTRGMTAEAFEDLVGTFLETSVHPVFGVPYTELVYRPMLELIEFLRANDFHVYVCTGGGREFVRVMSEDALGVPREDVIGSAGALEYRDGAIFRKKGLELPIDEGAGKPVHIWKRTGRKPLFACGNSDGDIEMLQIARFQLLLHHDDGEREFAYDEKAEKVLAEAATHDWTVVSMRDDFATVF